MADNYGVCGQLFCPAADKLDVMVKPITSHSAPAAAVTPPAGMGVSPASAATPQMTYYIDAPAAQVTPSAQAALPVIARGNAIPAGEPSAIEMKAFIANALVLPADVRIKVGGFTQLAQEGLYILLREGVSRTNLQKFLQNPAVDAAGVGGANAILENLALLYDRKVSGIRSGFNPDKIDDKYLSHFAGRIRSTANEYEQALWIASCTDARHVQLGAQREINWQGLTQSDRSFLERMVLPDLDADFRANYRQQHLVSLDAYVSDNGHSRLVEIKRSLGDPNIYDAKSVAEAMLQVFRHALIVRQHQLAGIEYVIKVDQINPLALRNLVEALKATAVPYLIRIGTNLIQGGLSYNMTNVDIPRQRNRPLPALPRDNAAVRISQPAISVEHEVWNADIQRVLDLWVPGHAIKKMSMQQFTLFLQSGGSGTKQMIVDHIGLAIAAGQWERDVASAMRTELQKFRESIGVQFGQSTTNYLVKIAQLATQEVFLGQRNHTTHEVSADVLQWLAVSRSSLEGQIRGYIHAIWSQVEGAEMLISGATAGDLNYLRSELNELSVDHLEIPTFNKLGSLNLRQMLFLMGHTQFYIKWSIDVSAAHALLIRRDHLIGRIEEQISLIPIVPRAVEKVFTPFPMELLTDLRTQVLSLGALQSAAYQRPEALPTITPRPNVVLTQQAIDHMYDQLILFQPITTPQIVYYFPEELLKIEQKIASRLRQQGLATDDIAREVQRQSAEALKRLKGEAITVQSLDQLIPIHFVRSDHVNVNDMITGDPLDVTLVVKRVLANHTAAELPHVIRVVVMADGQKVHFVDWPRFVQFYPQECWQRMDSPTLKDAMQDPLRRKQILLAARDITAHYQSRGLQVNLGRMRSMLLKVLAEECSNDIGLFEQKLADLDPIMAIVFANQSHPQDGQRRSQSVLAKELKLSIGTISDWELEFAVIAQRVAQQAPTPLPSGIRAATLAQAQGRTRQGQLTQLAEKIKDNGWNAAQFLAQLEANMPEIADVFRNLTQPVDGVRQSRYVLASQIQLIPKVDVTTIRNWELKLEKICVAQGWSITSVPEDVQEMTSGTAEGRKRWKKIDALFTEVAEKKWNKKQVLAQLIAIDAKVAVVLRNMLAPAQGERRSREAIAKELNIDSVFVGRWEEKLQAHCDTVNIPVVPVAAHIQRKRKLTDLSLDAWQKVDVLVAQAKASLWDLQRFITELKDVDPQRARVFTNLVEPAQGKRLSQYALAQQLSEDPAHVKSLQASISTWERRFQAIAEVLNFPVPERDAQMQRRTVAVTEGRQRWPQVLELAERARSGALSQIDFTTALRTVYPAAAQIYDNVVAPSLGFQLGSETLASGGGHATASTVGIWLSFFRKLCADVAWPTAPLPRKGGAVQQDITHQGARILREALGGFAPDDATLDEFMRGSGDQLMQQQIVAQLQEQGRMDILVTLQQLGVISTLTLRDTGSRDQMETGERELLRALRK